MTKIDQNAGWYGDRFNTWNSGDYGPKPASALLGQVHGLGCRPGKQALAIACMLRPHGVTGAQIIMICGAPQLNKARGLIADGLLKRQAHEPDKVGHTVYQCVITPKGEKRIAKAAELAALAAVKAGEAKPAKAKPKAAAKAKPKGEAVAPAAESNPPPVPPQADAPQAQPGM